MIHDFRSACCWLAGILMGAAYMANSWPVLLAAFVLVVPYRKCGDFLDDAAEWYVSRKHADEYQLIGRPR